MPLLHTNSFSLCGCADWCPKLRLPKQQKRLHKPLGKLTDGWTVYGGGLSNLQTSPIFQDFEIELYNLTSKPPNSVGDTFAQQKIPPRSHQVATGRVLEHTKRNASFHPWFSVNKMQNLPQIGGKCGEWRILERKISRFRTCFPEERKAAGAVKLKCKDMNVLKRLSPFSWGSLSDFSPRRHRVDRHFRLLCFGGLVLSWI